MFRLLILAGSALFVIGLPLAAHAQVGALPGIIDALTLPWLSTATLSTSPNCSLVSGVGACKLAALFVYALQRARLLVSALAFVIIIVEAFRLVISQAEDALGKARNAIVGAATGLIVAFLSERLVEALYGGFSDAPATRLDTSASLLSGAGVLTDELLGVLRAGEMIIAIVAITLLIVQAIYVFGSFGSEEGIKRAYRAVLYTVFGILLIVFDRAIATIFGFTTLGAFPTGPSTAPFFIEVFGFIRFLLVFVAIIAISVILYAGGLMLANYGSDEILTRGKTILLQATIGLALIVTSFVIVSTIILGIT